MAQVAVVYVPVSANAVAGGAESVAFTKVSAEGGGPLLSRGRSAVVPRGLSARGGEAGSPRWAARAQRWGSTVPDDDIALHRGHGRVVVFRECVDRI